jgi:hypothetical protein
MHGVCGGAVQRRVNGGVRRVRARLSDGHAGIVGGHHVCGVPSRAVQRSVDDGVCSVRCGTLSGKQWPGSLCGVFGRVNNRHSRCVGRDQLHFVRCREVQQRVHRCV